MDWNVRTAWSLAVIVTLLDVARSEPCTTKGVMGDNCEKCDTENYYFRDPVTGGCFYNLALQYQFTFNLSRPHDKYYTAINLKTLLTPHTAQPEVDVDFSISCSAPAKMNVSFRQTGKDGLKTEHLIFTQENCSQLKHSFSKDVYSSGSEEDTAFYVTLYDFNTPFWFIVSFSQQAQMQPLFHILQFFGRFSAAVTSTIIAWFS